MYKEQKIMANILVMMAKNYMNVVVIIFTLTVLDSKTPISLAMVDVEEMVGVVMVLV